MLLRILTTVLKRLVVSKITRIQVIKIDKLLSLGISLGLGYKFNSNNKNKENLKHYLLSKKSKRNIKTNELILVNII